jgi:uncharacterized RDD family membrane protein YckC
MTSLPAGWYKDPADPSTQRWWDGDGWLGKPLPADATPPDGPPPADEPDPVVEALAAGSAPTEPPAPGAPQAVQPAPGAGPTPEGAPPGWQVPPGYQPPAGWQPPPGWTPPPPGYQQPPPGWAPPAGYQQPPPGWQPPPGSQTPPPGWQAPPPGWPQQPPQGWTPPPGYPLAYAYPPQARPHGLPLAGLGRRLVARLVDIVAVLILNVLVNGWLAYQWWLEVEPVFRATMADPFATPQEVSVRSSYLVLTILVVATALWFAYEVPALANSGQTLGKRLLQVKVVKVENTEALGFGRAFRRWARLGMWTPFWSCYGLGFLAQLIDSGSVLFDQKLHQALHDKSAATVVVAVPPGSPAPPAPAQSENADDSTGGKR